MKLNKLPPDIVKALPSPGPGYLTPDLLERLASQAGHKAGTSHVSNSTVRKTLAGVVFGPHEIAQQFARVLAQLSVQWSLYA
jgi:hypothetical protein